MSLLKKIFQLKEEEIPVAIAATLLAVITSFQCQKDHSQGNLPGPAALNLEYRNPYHPYEQTEGSEDYSKQLLNNPQFYLVNDRH